MDEQWINTLKFHHTGCVTKSIDAAKKIYSNMLGFTNVSETFYISSQQVKVCFVEIGPAVFLELVEPEAENPFFKELLRSKNPFYHTGFLASNFTETLQQLISNKFYLLSQFNSAAFDNRQCAFLYTPQMQLVEIIEQKY